MIKINNLAKSYKEGVYVLKDINLYIKPGEFVSLVGKSGSGKSTLIKLLIAELKLEEGEIIIGGWDISNLKNYEIPTLRRQVGVIFQDFKLLPKKTALENVNFAMEVCGFKNKIIKTMGLHIKVKFLL